MRSTQPPKDANTILNRDQLLHEINFLLKKCIQAFQKEQEPSESIITCLFQHYDSLNQLLNQSLIVDEKSNFISLLNEYIELSDMLFDIIKIRLVGSYKLTSPTFILELLDKSISLNEKIKNNCKIRFKRGRKSKTEFKSCVDNQSISEKILKLKEMKIKQLIEMNRYDDAEHVLKETYVEITKASSNYSDLTRGKYYLFLAQIYAGRNISDKAIKYSVLGYAQYEKIKDHSDKALLAQFIKTSTLMIGESYEQKKKYEEAILWYELALDVLLELKNSYTSNLDSVQKKIIINNEHGSTYIDIETIDVIIDSIHIRINKTQNSIVKENYSAFYALKKITEVGISLLDESKSIVKLGFDRVDEAYIFTKILALHKIPFFIVDDHIQIDLLNTNPARIKGLINKFEEKLLSASSKNLTAEPFTSSATQVSTSGSVELSASTKVEVSTSGSVEPSASTKVEVSTSGSVEPSTSSAPEASTSSTNVSLKNSRKTKRERQPLRQKEKRKEKGKEREIDNDRKKQTTIIDSKTKPEVRKYVKLDNGQIVDINSGHQDELDKTLQEENPENVIYRIYSRPHLLTFSLFTTNAFNQVPSQHIIEKAKGMAERAKVSGNGRGSKGKQGYVFFKKDKKLSKAGSGFNCKLKFLGHSDGNHAFLGIESKGTYIKEDKKTHKIIKSKPCSVIRFTEYKANRHK